MNKQNRMKKYLILTLLGFLVSNIISQNLKKCDSILSNTYNLNNIIIDRYEFYSNLKILFDCEFDSIDFKIIVGDQYQSEVLPNYLLEASRENLDSTSTFSMLDLMNVVKKYINTIEYQNTKNKMKITYQLSSKKILYENWKSDKLLLKHIGVSDSLINKIHTLIKNNPNKEWTYFDLFQSM